MKKLLLMLATAGLLSATATAQAGGTLLTADGGGGACAPNYKGNLCTQTTVQKCTDWKLTSVGVSLTLDIIPTGITYKYECAHWETTTTNTYYPA